MEPQVALPDTTALPPSYRVQMVESLAHLRQEWQDATQGESLLNVEANVGLLLYDVVNRLGLSQQEQMLLLGNELSNQIEAVIGRPLDM